MSHEIYIFGSVVRGEIIPTSDIDVLVIPFASNKSMFPADWSIYSPDTIKEYFRNGRLFAWHLHLEAQCIFTEGETSFLEALGAPAPYLTMVQDIVELEILLRDAIDEIESGTNNLIYELGVVYTAVRDIAMSASWVLLNSPNFSRLAPYKLPIPCPLSVVAYENLVLARHCSTRGVEISIDLEKTAQEVVQAPWGQWIKSLKREG